MSYRQFELETYDGRHLMCWLPDDGRLTEGRRLTLKHSKRVWRVLWRGRLTVPEPPRLTWKVGGLM